MTNKIIFIVNTLGGNHWRNRVREFESHGYEPTIYAFSRDGEYQSYDNEWPARLLSDFSNTDSYFKRVLIYIRTLRSVIKENKEKDVVYYFFGMDLAMFVAPFLKQPYLYEEFDLMHTYMGNGIVRYAMEKYDKWLIKHSLLTLLTSEGFVDFHFKKETPANVVLVPNRLNPKVAELPYYIKDEEYDLKHIRFGFVGAPRYKTMANFAKVIAEHFPQHEMHFYGKVGIEDEHFFTELQNKKNVFFHGYFKNPDDLPLIYSGIDILLSAYDADYENVRYAEPNKIYESVYFEKPIVVSSRTFLAEKVKRWGIGWDIDCMNDNEVVAFVSSLTYENIMEKKMTTQSFDKKDTLNINDELFTKLSEALR